MAEADADEWPPVPDLGRVITSSRLVRLSDAGPDGRLRLDGVARYLQDVATDDSDDAGYATGPGTDDVWVVRETTIRAVVGRTWPQLGDRVALSTWCGGLGRAWAIRRTDLSVDGHAAIETSARWVHLDGGGRPARLSEAFVTMYAAAAGGRSATARLPAPDRPPLTSRRTRWALRTTDLDVVGHVNNAAVWAGVVEVASLLPGPVRSARVAHHAPIEVGDEVTLCSAVGEGGIRLWMLVDEEVRVAGVVSAASGP